MTDNCPLCGSGLTAVPRLTDGHHWVCLECERKRKLIANPPFKYSLRMWWQWPDVLLRQWWTHRKWRKELGIK